MLGSHPLSSSSTRQSSSHPHATPPQLPCERGGGSESGGTPSQPGTSPTAAPLPSSLAADSELDPDVVDSEPELDAPLSEPTALEAPPGPAESTCSSC